MSGAGMLTFVLLLRSLKLEEMGYWIFFQTSFTLLDTFRAGFLQTALIKFYAGAEVNRAKEVLGSIWAIALLITLFWVIITIPALFMIPYIDDESIKIVIKWFAIRFIITLPSSLSAWQLQSDQKFDKLLLLSFITQGSFIVSIVILMLTNSMNIMNLIFADLIVASIVTTMCIVSGWSGIKYLGSQTKACMLEVYNFGKFSIGTSISSNLLRNSDVFMINFFLGSALVPVYNAAQRLMEVIEIPLRSVLVIAIPELSAAFNQKKIKDLLFYLRKYSGMLTLALIPVSLLGIVFADFLILLLGGGKYVGTDAANIFRVFLALSIIYPIDRFTGVSLDIVHQPKRNLIKVVIMLTINVVVNYIGILIFKDLYGIVLSSVIAFLVGALYSYFSLKKFLDFTLMEILQTGVYELKYLYFRFIKRSI